MNGVLAEERVINLPQDQDKWYVSVVGNANDARYNEILGWFDSNPSLAKLKDQVHFCPVASDTAIYKERYSANVKGLPTVRMQKSDGTVVYEAAGKNLPMTAAGLNGALAGAVSEAQGLRPILPWRRDADNRLNDLERPKPQPQPQPDPEPQPIDDGGTPTVEPEAALPDWLLAPICGAGFAGRPGPRLRQEAEREVVVCRQVAALRRVRALRVLCSVTDTPRRAAFPNIGEKR